MCSKCTSYILLLYDTAAAAVISCNVSNVRMNIEVTGMASKLFDIHQQTDGRRQADACMHVLLDAASTAQLHAHTFSCQIDIYTCM
jgi:hypothetical protein